jgi:ubiquitin-protein ligase E3 C
LIQRTTRGLLARLKCLIEFLPRDEIAAVSLCLSLRKWLYISSKTTKQVLLEFANHPHLLQYNNGNVEMEEGNESLWFSQKRIVHVTLQEFVPTLKEMECQAMSTILKNYWPDSTMDVPLFVDLVACFKKWWQDSSSETAYTTTLLIWAIEAHKKLNTAHSDALLASVLLTADASRLASLDNLYTTWFLPLVKVLNYKGTEESNALLKATFRNLQGGKENRILLNTLQIATLPAVSDNPLTLVKFIHHVLSRSNTSPLTLLVSLLIRGDSLDSSTAATTNEWVDDESDHEEEESDVDVAKPEVKRLRPTSRYSRRELLTMVKLDTLYQDCTQQMKRDCAADVLTTELAQKIVGAPWLSWGLKLLDEPYTSEPYINSLALLLQASSGLRPSMKLGILSPLAFSKQFLEKLWRHVRSSSDDSATIVFCDLFSHYLVALSDVDFVNYHTDHGDVPTDVMAKDVVVYLNQALYDVYWNKPVLAIEMQPGNVKARILLSGTKLWNSLYERWNRLVRHSFCDESTWWFPHLSSKEGDGAVIPVREQQQEDDDDDMAIEDDESAEGPNIRISAAEAETDALADAFRDPKMARILTCIPQALPFDRRVKLFHSLLKADKQKVVQAAASRQAMMAMQQQLGPEDMWMDGSVREKVLIRRAKLYKDSMKQLNALGRKLKHQVQVSFINQHGAEEAGIDGGGVFKEFLDDLIKDGFAANTSEASSDAPQLFSVTPLQTLAVNLDLTEDSDMLVHYEFLGRVLAKAVYESILVEPQFCLPFLNQLLAKTNTTEDLKNLDEEYYKNLNKLRTLGEAEIESLGLTFEMTIGGGGVKSPRTMELIPGGHSLPVTKKNVFQFIHLVSHQRMNVLGSVQTRAFLRGFRDLIPASWVRLFSASELQKLISGDDSIRGINVSSLRQAMIYSGGYHQSQPYIQDFWDILENDLTPEQQRKFLRFMTSCSRQPLLGFGSLEPAPAIQQIRLDDEELLEKSKLPTSQTCFNLLKLPNYKSRGLLKKKLIDAIEAGAGFELT